MGGSRDAGEPPDRDLLVRAQAGESDAFGALVERYMRRAYYTALGLVGSHDDALDLSQEAFVRAYRTLATVDPERPWFPWLYRIVRRLCFNHVRNRRVRSERLAQANEWLVMEAENATRALDPGRAVELDELRRQIAGAIDELAMDDREVLVLREFDGLSYRDIAEYLDIPTGTVMSRLYNARRRLATRLEKLL